MKFNYWELHDKLLEKISVENDSIYLCNNFSDKGLLENSYKKDIFSSNPIFLTLKEFKERVFLTDRFLLKEEKRTLLLYKALDLELKESLKIRNYYDFIDYGENFLSFYKELREESIENIHPLEPWQEKNFLIMTKLYENFIKLLDENSYMVPEFIETIEHLDLSYFKGYKKIVFVNIFNFTAMEKTLIKEIEKNFAVEFHLKMNKSDFNEKTLEFNEFNLDNFKNFNGKIYQVKDKFETKINLAWELYKNPEILTYSCDFENLNETLLSENIIIKNDKPLFQETKLYNFLEIMNNLLNSKEVIKGENFYKIDSFLNSIENKDFCRYFNIGKLQEIFFYETFLKNDYKYVNYRLFTENNKTNLSIDSFSRVFGFLEKLNGFETITGFTDFLSNQDEFFYKFFNEELYVDIFQKYFETLTEVKSIEMLNFNFIWTDFFDKTSISKSIFKLILKYLKHKKLEKTALSSYGTKILDFKEDSSLFHEKALIIDISNETYPPKAKSQFLLSNKQRKNLGLKTFEKEKNLLKYYFFQKISSMEEVTIYSLKNTELNIDSSSFVEELILHKNLIIEENQFSEKDLPSFVKGLFDDDSYLKKFDLSSDTLPKSIDDFKNELYLGAYEYADMKECMYKFYINHIHKLSRYSREIDYDFENRTMGIIIHRLFEDLFKEYHNEFLVGNFVVEREKIRSTFEKILKKELYKIPQELKLYFEEIIMNIYIDGVYEFFQKLTKLLENEVIDNFLEEKSAKKDILSEPITMGLKGRGDLIILGKNSSYIVDIKTGGSNDKQLPFYERLYFEEKDNVRKFIYNAWEKNLEENNDIITTDELSVEFREFLSKNKFQRAEKSATCRYCDFQNLCRMRWDNE